MRLTWVLAAVLAALVLGGCGHVADDVDPGLDDAVGDLPGDATPDLAADESSAPDLAAEAETHVPEAGPETADADETPDGDVSPEVPPCECLKDEDCAAKGRGLGSCETMWCDTAACACRKKSLPDQTGCEDGNPCTTPDRCQAGTCIPGANTCQCQADADCKPFDDDNLCNGVLKCDKTTAPYTCKVDSATVVKCEDDLKLPCRTKKCETATGKCLVLDINEGQPCDDKSLCTVDAKCAGGDCVGASQVTCSTANLCTNAVCVFGKGCTEIPNNRPCEDGEVCTVGDQCGGGACVSGAWDPCDDKKDCTQDTCEKGVGCHHADLTGTGCEDGDACTVGDNCDAGTCLPGAAPDCDDKNVCTDDSCDRLLGCTHSNNALPCDDGDLCTLDDACAKGKCVGGAKKGCDDQNACTKDGCTPATGECTHDAANCDDKNACTVDTCDSLTGCAHTAVDCDDGSACTTDSCTGNADGTHTCNHKAVSCDDKIAATVDSCVPATGCVHACDDKNPCTVDLLDPVKGCLFTPVNCDDGDACTTDACDKTTGQCSHVLKTCATPADKCQVATCDRVTGTCGAAARNCDDGDTCTLDSCEAATGSCAHVSKTSNSCGPCQVEVCDLQAGTSVCVNRVCDDKDPCTVDACDPTSGACMYVAKVEDDLDPCTIDRCDPATGVIGHVPIDVQDGNPCTVDRCDPATGAITHVAKDCKDLNESMTCRDCACNPYTGVETLVPRACADGDPCTLDYCDGAKDACVNRALDCNDANPCTSDGCDPATGGCLHVPNTLACATERCQDLLHFGGSTCAAGACPAQILEDCNDYNPCTDDTCDAMAGCAHKFNAAPCATARCDGLKHYSATACALGACGVQVLENCDDGNVCTDDSCDATAGCTHTPVAGQCATAACLTWTTFQAARQCDAAGGCIAATTADCTPYLCAETGCPATCASDAGCVPTHFCDAPTGTCVKRLVPGAACNRAGQCAANHCVEGVCCDGPCDGACQSCVLPGSVGLCRLADVGTDPRNECNDQGAANCGQDGLCDGAGACRKYPNGTGCGAAACGGLIHYAARKCASGSCLQAVPDDNCDDDNPCTADSCAADGCHHGEVIGPCGPASCLGAWHYFAPQCGSGLCQPAAQDQQCLDSNPCTDDACTVAGCAFTDNAARQSCYDGPAGTAGVGRCTAGTRTCASGAWGACAGEVVPASESCNGTDDDCNHVVDDGAPCAARQVCDGGACTDCPAHCAACLGAAACITCDAGWAGITCGTNVCTGQAVGTQPTGCAGIRACDGHGNCLAANGQGCPDGGTCASGNCFDGGTGGLCCDQACNDGNACTTDSCGGGVCTHTLAAACPNTVGWCQVFAPKSIGLAFVTDRPTVQGQVYIAGVTDQTDCANDLRPEVVAQLGIAPHGKDPSAPADAGSWSWASAPAVPGWNACDAGFHNNDGYQATLVPPAAGQWDYAFRFSANGGFTWTTCDAVGTPYDVTKAATMAVKGTGDAWCRLQWPAVAPAAPGAAFSAFGRVYAPGATTATKFANDPVNAALKGQFGYGPRGAVDPSTFTWSAAAQSTEYATSPDPEENNDEYKATVPAPAPGEYDYAFRFSLDAGQTWKYCDRTVGPSNGSADGYQPDNAGKLTSACGAAQYFLGGACIDCDSSCATCSGPGPGACQG